MGSQNSPMMQQFEAAKARCPGAIVLFRMGDFYELFGADAREAATLLDLTLTSRDKGTDPLPMAGFPHHAAETYINRLIKANLKVAICEQLEEPAEAKGIVDRGVVRVITRGTATEDALLEGRANNYLI